MDTPDSVQIVISLVGDLLAAALGMIGHKLLGVAVFVFSTGLLWWSILPLIADRGLIDIQSFSLWVGGGWAALIIIGLLWGWAIVRFTPTPTPGVQVSSTNQSGGVNAPYGNITINHPLPEKSEKIEPLTYIPSLSLSVQNDMVLRLRDILTSSSEQPRVTVEPKTLASYSFAHTLAAIFESAGWKTEFRDPLRDPVRGFQMHPHTMNRGMGVMGANTHLVTTVAGILRDAGCTQIATVAQPSIQETPPPQWNQGQHFVHIEVSYQR